MTYTTFEEWSKSKVWHNNLNMDDEQNPGFMYADGAYITLPVTLSYPHIWWTIVERSEMQDIDLNVVQKWLWDNWSKDNIGE